MKKKLLMAVGVPVVILTVMAGCGQNSNNNTPNPNPDMTNPPPALATNAPPMTNTDLINTNLSTNATGSATNNP